MADLTYNRLQRAVTELARDVTRASDAIRSRAHLMAEEARDTSNVAEMIGGMRVDADTIGETRELSKITTGLSEASMTYASAANTTAKAANNASAQARTTHSGIKEAVSRSPVAGIYDVNSQWFDQE